jgi:hypothetical protein
MGTALTPTHSRTHAGRKGLTFLDTGTLAYERFKFAFAFENARQVTGAMYEYAPCGPGPMYVQ